MKETAVLYFSRDGSTRIAAGIIADKLDADLVELVEQKGGRNFLLSGFKAASKKHSQLAGDPWAEVSGCSTLVIGSPIWAGNGNPAVNGFLDKADLSGKKVYLFTLQADTRRSKSDEVLAHLSKRVEEAGGAVAGTMALTGASPGKTAEEGDLKEALSSWDLLK